MMAMKITFSSPKEFFHCQYFEVLDVLKGELTRFDQPTFAILREMEKILIDSCNDEKNIVLSTEIKTLYANNLDMNKLTTQLSILSSVIEASNNDYQMGIKSVTSLNTICELFTHASFQDQCFQKWTNSSACITPRGGSRGGPGWAWPTLAKFLPMNLIKN